MKYAPGRLIVVILAVCASIPAAAGVIHKWVDADGVTHYADAAPAAVDIPVTVIDVPSTQFEPENTSERYYSIINQWERVRRERIERDRLALEKARLEAGRQVSSPTPAQIEEAATRRIVTALPAYPYAGTRHHRKYRKYGHRYRGGRGWPGHPRPRQQAGLGYFPHVD